MIIFNQWGIEAQASQMMLVVKNPPCQCRLDVSHKFNPWIRKMSCRRKWQPTPVLLAGESHGQRSLEDGRP